MPCVCKMPIALLIIVAITGGGGEAYAATIAYDFVALSTAPSVTAPGTTASSFSAAQICGSFGNPATSGSCGRFSNTGTSGTDFTFFTVTPNAGVQMNLVSFSFDEINGGSFGPIGFDIYTIVDGFASSILGGALSPSAVSFTNHSVSLGSAPFQGLTTPFAVRLSGFGGPNLTQSAWLLDNVSLNLTTTSVPEPMSFVIVGVGLFGLAVFAAVNKIERGKSNLS